MLKKYLKYIFLTSLVILSQLFVFLQNYKSKDLKYSINTTLHLYYIDEKNNNNEHESICSMLEAKDKRLLEEKERENFLQNREKTLLVHYNKMLNLTTWSSLLQSRNLSDELSLICDKNCNIDDPNLSKILLVNHPLDRLNRIYRYQVMKGGLSVTFYKNISELLGIKRYVASSQMHVFIETLF